MDAIYLIVFPYTAVSFSIMARFIFMYLLYTKKSTNLYSLTFCYLSILSSSLWIPYGIMIEDHPIIIRSSVEIILLSTSAVYITYNRYSMRSSPLLPTRVSNTDYRASQAPALIGV